MTVAIRLPYASLITVGSVQAQLTPVFVLLSHCGAFASVDDSTGFVPLLMLSFAITAINMVICNVGAVVTAAPLLTLLSLLVVSIVAVCHC